MREKEVPDKKLLFSVTAKDCDWSYYVGPGNGGQKKNKTHSAALCVHKLSGAQGKCHDSRSREQNRKKAFERMANTKEFKDWHKAEIARRTGEAVEVERKIQETMKEENFKTEVKVDGKWVELKNGN